MKTVNLINARVFDGEAVHENARVRIEGGRILELAENGQGMAEASVSIDLEGRLLAPGLIDIQVNGGGGVLFNDAPTVETIRTIGAAHRRFGTTGFLPTLISSTASTTADAIRAVRQAIEEKVPGVLGIHLEGPFLAAAKRGIHDAAHFRTIDEDGFEQVTSLGIGRTLLTVAPEMTGPDWIQRLTNAGIIVFAGHSNAEYEQVREALDAGLRGFTHLFNAMSPFESRSPGMVGTALSDRKSYAGLICDGYHVHPASFAAAVAAKGSTHCLLVTDAMATVGSETGDFEWNGETVLARGGCCRLPDGSLAGSDLDMMTAVRNAMRYGGMNRFEALRMASTYPAQAMDLDDELGYIRPGYRASFVELDNDMNLAATWIDGERQEAH
jgi:N-acetylglucosamine-6-phosphate deacetylase